MDSMPNLANAKKALRQSHKRFTRNNIKRQEIASLRRHFRKAVEAGMLDEAQKMLPQLSQKVDKAVKKNIFKKNKAARIKSRLSGMIKRAQEKTSA